MPSHGVAGGAPDFPPCHGHSELWALCVLQSSAAGPRDCLGPDSSSNSSPDCSLGVSPGLGRDGCHGNPEVELLAQRPPGVVVSSVPHNMAPLGPCARPVPPKRSLWSLLTEPHSPFAQSPKDMRGCPFHTLLPVQERCRCLRVRQRPLAAPA